jgi:hypothetical protein
MATSSYLEQWKELPGVCPICQWTSEAASSGGKKASTIDHFLHTHTAIPNRGVLTPKETEDVLEFLWYHENYPGLICKKDWLKHIIENFLPTEGSLRYYLRIGTPLTCLNATPHDLQTCLYIHHRTPK